jgi:ABC-type enterobactin transport system permease subunit
MKWLKLFFSGDNNEVDWKAVAATFCLAMAVGVWLCYVYVDLRLMLQGPVEAAQGSRMVRRCDMPTNIYNIAWAFIVAAFGGGIATIFNNNRLVNPRPPQINSPGLPGKIEGPMG